MLLLVFIVVFLRAQGHWCEGWLIVCVEHIIWECIL